jgi:hypothetical protein
MPILLTGQAVCTGVNNAIPLSSTPIQAQAFTIKAPLTNSAKVAIGTSTVTLTTGHLLDPGETFTYQRNTQGPTKYELEPSDFYVAGSLNDLVSWLASP